LEGILCDRQPALEHREQVAIELSGTDLVDMGFKQGPGFGKTLNLLLDAKLDGEIKSRDHEVKFNHMICLVYGKGK
jgi:hypothetical protein